MNFIPKEYQNIIVEHEHRYPRCAIHAPMGFGKSSATLMALDNFRYLDHSRTLVIAPLRVASQVWPNEVQKWDEFRHLSIVPIIGQPHERRYALKQDADIHTINYENLPWLVEEVGKAWRWSNVVADESTRLKSFRLRQGSVRARALSKVMPKVERFIELTGTPAPNGLQDLWGQLWFLDGGKRLGNTYSGFIRRWFRQIQCPGFMKLDGPLPGAADEIMRRVSDICMSLRVSDWFDVAEPIVVDVPVYLPEDARRIYRDMEREMYAEIEANGVEALNAAAKTMKCLQIANGAAYTDEEKNWVRIHDAKLDALESVIEEANGMPVLVVYHFKSDLTRILKRFKQAVPIDKDSRTIDKWNAGKIPILCVHPASAGHGLNMQYGSNIVAAFGHWWDLEQYQQVIERIGPVRQKQAGYDRPVYIYQIRAVDTVDDLVIERKLTRRSVQDILLSALARRKS